MTEIQALQNSANFSNTSGLMIHQQPTDDKRKTTKRYFLQLGTATISPVLDYEQMNCFLLGFNKCKQLKP